MLKSIASPGPLGSSTRFQPLHLKSRRDRFSLKAKLVFNNLKKFSSYDNFGKRDGSIMTEAKYNDKIIEGEELDRTLFEHYR